jgi:hypothetical protein
MATNAVISFVNEKKKTIVKIVVGSNGGEYANFVAELEEEDLDIGDDNLENILELAIDYFDHVVVMSEKRHVSEDREEELHPRWRETFSDPWFNPRWEAGIASFVYVIMK